MKIYEVGGAVRDRILNRDIHDIDHVVIGATENEMLSLGYKKVGKSFPVYLHPKTKEEYALARKEIKTGSKHKDFKFIFTPDISLKEDSIRRDFTCNAMYYDKDNDKIIDYHNGIEDTKNHILRHVSAHFSEDPLRVLRLCRFSAQLDFSVAPQTIELCQKMVKAGILPYISKERIWSEIEKALQFATFYRFVEVANQIGLMQEIFAEMTNTDDNVKDGQLQHLIKVLKMAFSQDSYVNYAILIHSIKNKIAVEEVNNPAKLIGKRLYAPNGYIDFSSFIEQNYAYYKKAITDKETLVEIAINCHHHKNRLYLKRYKDVELAFIKSKETSLDINELNKVHNFFQQLTKIIEVIENLKVNENKEFAEILNDVKKGLLPVSAIKSHYVKIILQNI